MSHSLEMKQFTIKETQELNSNTRLFTFEGRLNFKPGQIVEVRLPGFGQAPFAPTSNPSNKNNWQLAIRAVGDVTKAAHSLKIGDSVLISAPFGNGWPEKETKNKTVIIISGGLGLIPLRPFILNQLDKGNENLKIFYGSRDPEQIMFKDDLYSWKEKIYCRLTLDKAYPGWEGETGFVTDCLSRATFEEKNSIAFVCGPPVMFRGVVNILQERGLPEEQIYLSLERKMQCGIGKCQHCAIGPYYVCKDGPVFCYKTIREYL